ncbi:hypothetical protein ACHAXA_006062 [Cyclostephanos tholiformis]|uniref:Uncharacterized protein n=1 Tax=Cyclostephanos tholiformis TaxID=382380 RepID=A0ABD3SAV5_9STRA
MVGTSPFDEYSTRPTTCARLAYSSSVYDRIVHLWGDGIGDEAVIVDAPRSTTSPALRGFLRKLLSLAATDAKIREVTLLVLLEPIRRSSRAGGRRFDDIAHRPRVNRGHRYDGKCVVADASELTSRLSGTLGDAVDTTPIAARAPLSHDDTGLSSPMLAPATPRTDFITLDDAEGECARPPLSTLARLILRMGKATANDDKAAGAAWWNLPSPLLCAVSHNYLQIALEYVRYWIKMAAIGHAELYDTPPALIRSDDGIDNGIGIGIGSRLYNSNGYKDEDDGELFRRAIRRITHFRSTSDRLDLICRHELQSIDTEQHGSSVKSHSKGNKDEDAAFKTSLAWKAIHLALE